MVVTAAGARGLAGFIARATGLVAGGVVAADADRIDRIALLEQIKSAVAAAQHTQMVRFARSQVDLHIADDTLDPKSVGRGVADQIALACRVSPFTGSRRLGVARALHFELSGIRALLAAGRISEDTAALVTVETSHLDADRRGQVDAQLCAAGIEQLSPRRAAALTRRCAHAADPAGYVARGRTARADRRVTLRPAPDTMSLLTGFLPVEQGVACLAALRRHTDGLLAAGDARGRGQFMADTLVERVSGLARAGDVNVEVGIVMSLDSLVGAADGAAQGAAEGSVNESGGAGTAEVIGQGPIPAGIARDLLQATEGKRWWRRLFTMPDGGPLVGGDPRRRAFDGVQRRADRGARRRPLSRPVLRRPDPARRPHPPAPGGRPDELRERAWGMCPRELRAGDARLAGGCRRRRARPTSAYGAHDHPDRAHLHQHRRARSVGLRLRLITHRGQRSTSCSACASTRRPHREQLDDDQLALHVTVAVAGPFQRLDGGAERGVGEQAAVPVGLGPDSRHGERRHRGGDRPIDTPATATGRNPGRCS